MKKVIRFIFGFVTLPIAILLVPLMWLYEEEDISIKKVFLEMWKVNWSMNR